MNIPTSLRALKNDNVDVLTLFCDRQAARSFVFFCKSQWETWPRRVALFDAPRARADLAQWLCRAQLKGSHTMATSLLFLHILLPLERSLIFHALVGPCWDRRCICFLQRRCWGAFWLASFYQTWQSTTNFYFMKLRTFYDIFVWQFCPVHNSIVLCSLTHICTYT